MKLRGGFIRATVLGCSCLVLVFAGWRLQAAASRNLLAFRLTAKLAEIADFDLPQLVAVLDTSPTQESGLGLATGGIDAGDATGLTLQGIAELLTKPLLARASLEQAVQREPNAPLARYWLAVSQYAGGERQAAVENWARAGALPYLLQIAAKHMRQGQRTTASEWYGVALEVATRTSDAVRLNHEIGGAYRDLGKIAWDEGRIGDATAYLEKAVAVFPDRTLFRSDLSQLYAAQGRFDSAVAQAVVLTELEPDAPEWPTVVGDYYLLSGDPAAAEKAFLLGLKKRDGSRDAGDKCWHARAWLGLSTAYIASRLWGESVAAGIQALRVNDGANAVWKSRLSEVFDRALLADPERAEWYLTIGVAYQEIGDVAEARHYYIRGLERWPGRTEFKEGLARLPAAAELKPGVCP